jgi:hypothetical protein
MFEDPTVQIGDVKLVDPHDLIKPVIGQLGVQGTLGGQAIADQ